MKGFRSCFGDTCLGALFGRCVAWTFFPYHVGVLLATSYCSRRSLVLPRQRSEGHFVEFRSQSD